ncbi:hypothetical protein CcCBS67573_g01002 [Chytriomyces confervae]|uniref:SH3 domain-containing protein n=1 Tax=Chytriomyces confervae TaxID=246404 RepID=A0A507FND1_9FUNG|nr:hypothetical protein CcCBS67573_g01002 [Chytriomyces confervae]
MLAKYHKSAGCSYLFSRKEESKSASSVLFVQDGKAALSEQARSGAVGTAGSALRGHVYVSVAASIKTVKVQVLLRGTWTAAWRPRKPLYNANGMPLTPVVDGPMEAVKEVASLHVTVYEGPLLRGEHGLPVVLQLPASLPPSVATPVVTIPTSQSAPSANPSAAVPINAKCVYELKVSVTANTLANGIEEKVFTVPVTLMTPSGLRAAYIRNQPRPMIYSNRLNLLVPGTISQDTALISPFSFALSDPLDPSIRTAETSTQPIPIKDSGKLLYDLDVARLHHYIGDAIPFTMAIKPTSIEHQVHSITASLITHIHFHLPKTLATYQRPPSSAIAVRLSTQTFDWGLEGSGLTRRFHFNIPDSVASCPTMPDTPQNRLPFACLHMLRISVRVMNTVLGDSMNRLQTPQPVSAVRVSAIDSLVLDVPVVLVAKGDGTHLWGIPRVPRGWRVGQFVSTAALADSNGSSKQDGQMIITKGAKTNANTAISAEQQNRKSTSGIFGRVFGSSKPNLQQHPKYSADELNQMARDAMKAAFEETELAGRFSGQESPLRETPSKKGSNEKASDRPISPPLTPAPSVIANVIETVAVAEVVENNKPADSLKVMDPSVSDEDADASTQATPPTAISAVLDNEGSASPLWEFQPELDDTTEISNQDDSEEDITDFHRHASDAQNLSAAAEAVAASIIASADKIAIPVAPETPTSPTPEFHSKTLKPSLAAQQALSEKPSPKIDQFARELEQGVDSQGRFLPSNEFSGFYRVLYPYLENLRADEVRLAVGDVVRVSVSYVDGWAKGKNETSGDEGFLPLHCLVSERNAIVEDGRSLGKWFNHVVSQQAELPNDFKFLCHHETRYKLVKSLVTSRSPAMAEIEMPQSAHMNLYQKRVASSWVDAEKCAHCYSQAAPEK